MAADIAALIGASVEVGLLVGRHLGVVSPGIGADVGSLHIAAVDGIGHPAGDALLRVVKHREVADLAAVLTGAVVVHDRLVGAGLTYGELGPGSIEAHGRAAGRLVYGQRIAFARGENHGDTRRARGRLIRGEIDLFRLHGGCHDGGFFRRLVQTRGPAPRSALGHGDGIGGTGRSGEIEHQIALETADGGFRRTGSAERDARRCIVRTHLLGIASAGTHIQYKCYRADNTVEDPVIQFR